MWYMTFLHLYIICVIFVFPYIQSDTCRPTVSNKLHIVALFNVSLD